MYYSKNQVGMALKSSKFNEKKKKLPKITYMDRRLIIAFRFKVYILRKLEAKKGRRYTEEEGTVAWHRFLVFSYRTGKINKREYTFSSKRYPYELMSY